MNDDHSRRFRESLAPPSPFAEPVSSDKGVASVPTAGMGLALDERGKVPGATLKLSILSADPASPFEGQIWLRSDLNEIRWRASGVTYKAGGTA
jgi:hypothetical protein